MPERLAQTDRFKQVTEMIGGGPYRYLANEHVPGAHVVYSRNTAYRPRDDGPLEWTAGPKIAHFERIEWTVISDAATASAALQNGKADRRECVSLDLVPLLRQAPGIKVAVLDEAGLTCNIRMNQAIPPSDKAAVRQAVPHAVNQQDYMVALAGADSSLWRTDFGFFTICSPMATAVGLEVLHGKHDPTEIRRALADGGYRGEKVGILVATDVPTAKAASRDLVQGEQMARPQSYAVAWPAIRRIARDRGGGAGPSEASGTVYPDE